MMWVSKHFPMLVWEPEHLRKLNKLLLVFWPARRAHRPLQPLPGPA